MNYMNKSMMNVSDVRRKPQHSWQDCIPNLLVKVAVMILKQSPMMTSHNTLIEKISSSHIIKTISR